MSISKLIKLLKQLIFLAVYPLSFLIKRNKKIWIYGSGSGFRDNTKYFFLYNCEAYPEIKHIWISTSHSVINKLRTLGYAAYYKNSLSAIYYALVAKVYIYHSFPKEIIHPVFRGNSFSFNLWHGVPFKKIEYDVKKGPLRFFLNPQNFKEKFTSFLIEPRLFRKSSAVLSPSQKTSDIFSSAFLLKPSNVFVGAYPRNTIFNLEKIDIIKHIRRIEDEVFENWCNTLQSFSAVIIYMPTYRDINPNFMDDAISNFDHLNEICKQNNFLFLIKSHVSTVFSKDLSNYTNIKNLEGGMDIYPLLPFTDVLISDYSSVLFDYSLLNKKMIFYPFDKEDYFQRDREFYFSYEEVFSDNYTTSFEGLISEIESLATENVKSNNYYYQGCRSLINNDSTSGDIVNYIKKSINY